MTLKSELVSHYSLQINPKESNDCTTITKQHNPNNSHDCFSFCVDPKESHDCFYQQCIGPNESNVRNESHVAFFRHQRVRPSKHCQEHNKTWKRCIYFDFLGKFFGGQTITSWLPHRPLLKNPIRTFGRTRKVFALDIHTILQKNLTLPSYESRDGDPYIEPTQHYN